MHVCTLTLYLSNVFYLKNVNCCYKPQGKLLTQQTFFLLQNMKNTYKSTLRNGTEIFFFFF